MVRLVCPILLAASLLPLHAAAQAPHADGLTLSVEARAQVAYQSGRDLFRTGEFAAAVDDFRRSLDLVDSPNTRMYLGRALLRLGRVTDAYATLDRAATDADRRAEAEPRYAATRDSARSEADAVRRDIALVTVRVAAFPEGATLRVGGIEVPRTAVGYPLPFMPGEVIVELDAPGYAPAREILILTPGGAGAVELSPRADPTEAAPSSTSSASTLALSLRAPGEPARRWTAPRVAGLTMLSAGAAAAITGVVFGVFAWSDHQVLSSQAELSSDNPLIDRGELRRDIANVLIAGGSAVAAGGLIMFLLGGRGAESPRAGVRVDVGLGGGGATLGIRGSL